MKKKTILIFFLLISVVFFFIVISKYNSFIIIFNNYFIYSFIILFLIFLLIILFKRNYNFKANSNSCSLIQKTNHPDVWINDLINIFYYAKLHNKTISIILIEYKDDYHTYEKEMYCHIAFSHQNILFLLDNKNNNYIFYVTYFGMITKIVFQYQDSIYDLNKKNILIIQNKEQLTFTIKTNETNFFDITSNYLTDFLKTMLKKNKNS